MVLVNNYEYTNYSVIAWVYDKRCNDNCRIKTFDTESYDEALKWISTLKQCYGDSAELINRVTQNNESIELRKDQILFP